MTRSIVPCPVAPAAPNHPGAPQNLLQQTGQVSEGGDIQGDQSIGAPTPSVPMGSAAVPISVTTASHADPPVALDPRHQNVKLPTGGIKLPKQFHLAHVKPATNLSPTGGFTLPGDVVGGGLATAAVDASRSQQTPSPQLVLAAAEPAPPSALQGYSAASRASINAHDVNKTSSTAVLGRRIHSAPALVPNKNKSKYTYRKVVGGKLTKSTSMIFQTEVSPQVFLDKMLQARGYSTNNFCSLDGGYYCKPTPLQKASYGIKLVRAIRASDADLLKRLISCGLSPNPCNAFGESIVHMVCRRGDAKLLKVLMDAGCSLQVTDDFGRTPLHDACWTAEPCFDCVELILRKDARLLHVVDCRGSSPLSYVKREHWKQWIEFFRSRADRYWAPRDVSKEGDETPPQLANKPPHSCPVPDPKNAVPVEIATLVSSGKLEPEDVLRQKKECLESKPEPVAAATGVQVASSAS